MSTSSSNSKGGGYGEWDKANTRTTTSYNNNPQDVALELRLHHQYQQQQQQLYSSTSGGDGIRRVTFTPNQRQELERQTVIYKYMMASMPVPPELIIPLSKYPSSQPNLPTLLDQLSGGRKGGVYGSGGGRGGGGDAEPWRCRRTDGKKWRCSRDVAPDQKYCERHSHKGRNSARSRKPVESSLANITTTNATTVTSSSDRSSNPIVLNPFQQHLSSSYDLPSSLRYPEWIMREEPAQVLYPQQIQSHASDHTTRLSRPFIDAWSLEDVHKDKCPNTSPSMNSLLPLTLSMSAGFDLDHGQNNNTKDNDHETQQHSVNWASSWSNLPSGGPLAEALCLGISGSTNNAWGNHSDDLVSPHGHSSSSTGTSKGSHASGGDGQGFHLLQ